MFVIQTKKFTFVNILIYDMFLTDVYLFNLFMKAFIFNHVTITDVNLYNVALQKL